MGRYKFTGTFRDGSGNIVAGGTVSVFESGTTTAATIYETATGTTAVNSTTSGTDGVFTFYIMEGDYYGDHTRKLILSKTGFSAKTYDYTEPTDFYNGAFTQSTIESALIAIGTTNKATLLLRPGTWVISSNADWSAYTNVTLKMPAGALLQIATGTTTTIGGPFDGDLSQKFDCDGTGKVVFGSGAVTAVYPNWWGMTVSAADNHDAILAAATCAYNSGGIPVKFSAGHFKTSPISFLNLRNVQLVGAGGNPWRTNTTLYGVSGGAGDVLLQFASTVNPFTATEFASAVPGATVTDIFVDVQGAGTGTSGINIGINGNQLTLKGVTTRRAKTHGIVLEDYSYPCNFYDVETSYNDGHGLYIRGPMSTVNNFYHITAASNGQYGVLIEGGAGLTFETLVVQSNDVGGLKINRADYTGSPHYYIQMMNFNNFYAEANGTLDPADPLYEGNYSLVMTSYSATAGPYNGPFNIVFSNSQIWDGTTGNCINMDSVNKYRFINCATGSGTILIGNKVYEMDGANGGGVGIGVVNPLAPLHVANRNIVHSGGGAISRWDFPTSQETWSWYQTFYALNDASTFVEYARIGAKIIKHDSGAHVGLVNIRAAAAAGSVAANRAGINQVVATTGGLVLYGAENTANIEADASTTITLSIPSGARLLGAQFRVDTALTTGETWDAAFSGGSTTALVSAGDVAKNTKINKMFVDEITTNTTDIAITKNGGGSFTAAGTIRVIVYYQTFTAMADAS